MAAGDELAGRLRASALRVVRLVENLPRRRSADVMGSQLLRAALSAGANYRAACRGRSRAEFVAKLGLVEEELDESLYWQEMLIGAKLVEQERLVELMNEGNELLAIVVASIRTARGPRRR